MQASDDISAKLELGAYWNATTTEDSWFVAPDNATVDPEGRLWIATDQSKYWQQTGRADGLFALETEGIRRGTPRMFFRVPLGAELCGPCFTPDGETLFLAVQNPGADGVYGYAGFEGPSVFEKPATRWPDFIAGPGKRHEGHAAPAFDHGHHQGGRRQDPLTVPASPPPRLLKMPLAHAS